MRIQELTPTPLVDASERKDSIVLTAPAKVRFRFLYLIFCLIRLGLGNLGLWVSGQLTQRMRARQIRLFAERMGYLWVKAGQLVAMRNDQHPDVFCNELDKLRYPAVGIPFDLVKQIVEAELSRPLAEVFEEIDPVPFRASFTHQMHRAMLKGSGKQVVVKIQRPGLEVVFRQDQASIHRLAAILRRFIGLDHIRWDSVFWELDQAVTAETDYRYEAANMRRMRLTMRKRQIYVPKVFQKISTQRMLVMEFVRGALVSDLVLVKVADPDRLEKWQKENNIDLGRVGRRLFSSFLRQLMEDNLVHGNLHPGNIILLRDSRFGLVDLSVLFTVESEFLRRYVQSMRALATRHYGRAADLTLLLCPELPVVDLPSLNERLVRCFRAWDARSELKRMPLHEKSLASLYRELSRILYSYRITPSQTFMKICYTWSTLDDSLCLLIPDVNFSRLFRKYFQGASRRAFREAIRGGSVMEGILGLRETLTEYQQILGTLLRRGALVFQGGTSKFSDAMATLFRMLRVATLGGIVLFTCKFLAQHTTWFENTSFRTPLDALPVDNTDVQVLVIVVGCYLFYMFGKLEWRFRQQDVRLPNTTTSSQGR